jgi:hypothetical protein
MSAIHQLCKNLCISINSVSDVPVLPSASSVITLSSEIVPKQRPHVTYVLCIFSESYETINYVTRAFFLETEIYSKIKLMKLFSLDVKISRQ